MLSFIHPFAATLRVETSGLGMRVATPSVTPITSFHTVSTAADLAFRFSLPISPYGHHTIITPSKSLAPATNSEHAAHPDLHETLDSIWA